MGSARVSDQDQAGYPRRRVRLRRAWISLSPKVMTALHRQAALQMATHPDGRLEGLVFAKPDGAPLRPQWVLDQLRRRTTGAGLPRIGLHDLRHTAASIMIAEDIPVAVVSKTMRHSTLAITINLYGHLLKDSADEAVTALSTALDRADAHHVVDGPTRALQFAA
ncbi:tyrosine-type recombinase/integrase [Kitasatospora purpeofusca]|uniref:tyrosine-type recombinase/integrase n=1 Tax=Kitasatospora purpeofusca TaxID=67352 RepID=UPI003651FCB1